MNAIAFLQPGPFEIIVVLFIILLLFGAKKLPGLARSMGKSLQEFKRGKDEVMRELTESQDDTMSSSSSSKNNYDYDEDIEDEDYSEDIETEEAKEAGKSEKSADEEKKPQNKTK